ncbi:coagulation factor IX-like [Culicoides brevitarsis]|uniref:coagulation factor IX-like n=1 Tax=Culicoides brevitarsis TaxID=469753 RepID=UPI00307CACDF
MNLISSTLLFTISLFFSEIAANSVRIIGGSSVKPNEIPFVVSVQSGGVHVCGGSILNENYVLTAARCVEESEDLTVVAGEHNLEDDDGNEQKREVAEVKVHEYYYRNKDKDFGAHDLALLKVAEPFELNDRVSKINLPEKKDTYPAGTALTAGWGKVGGILGIPRETDVLHKVEMDIQTQRKCLEDWDDEISTNRYICAGSASKRLCEGDVGGPLAQGNKDEATLVGVATYGPCGSLGFKNNLFVQVSKYLDWINEKLEE